MKTISMDLKEYENELRSARSKGYQHGFADGVFKTCSKIQWDIEHPKSEYDEFKHEDLARAVRKTIVLIRKFYSRSSVKVGDSDV